MAKVTIIRPEKGEGTYPTPEVRQIYPTRALLWKYYLTVFIIWVCVSLGFILLGWFIQSVADEPKPANFHIVFSLILLLTTLVSSLLPLSNPALFSPR